jgi:acyl dehydratase
VDRFFGGGETMTRLYRLPRPRRAMLHCSVSIAGLLEHTDAMDSFTNRTFDELEVGQSITRSHQLTRPDVEALAFVSGDVDPFHTDAHSVRQDTMSAEGVAAEALVSALLQRRLPGPGTVIVAQDLRFGGTMRVGDHISGTLRVKEKRAAAREVGKPDASELVREAVDLWLAKKAAK